ncbi:MAG: DbpA RNA binding domain-containing protein [marine benthic group bacterium]|nr:DbpA RNA binding domain-containing protein [Gemmatimonadota bacterium]
MTENEGGGIHGVADRLGWASVPEVLAESETALGRGHHLALVASQGSGLEAVYAAAALLLDAENETLDVGGARALVLCPTDERAGRVARLIRRALGPGGGGVFLVGAGVEDEGVPDGARIVVARPSRVLPAIRSGRFGTGALGLLVLDGVSDLEQLDEWSSVEPLLEAVGSDVRKIAATGRPDPGFRQLLERQLPRARRWPEELLPAAGSESDPSGEIDRAGPPIRVAVGPEPEWLALLESCIAEAEASGGAIRVTCADPHQADEVAAALAVGGRDVEREDSEIRVGAAGPEGIARSAILFGAPMDLSEFDTAFADTEHRFVIVDPGRLNHVETLSRRAGLAMIPAGGGPLTDPLDAVVNYRRRLEDAVRSADFVPELLVLEPLIIRYGAARVAAGLSALLRRTDDDVGSVIPWPDIEAASLTGAPVDQRPPPRDSGSHARGRGQAGSGGERRGGATPRGARPAWTKLYFGIGRKDDIKPGDLVGAITGETGIVGGQIGKIDIRGGFSLVEVDSQVVDDVLRRLQGVTIRGRDVPVRADRER